MNATFRGWRAPIVPILALAFAAAFGIAAAAEPRASTGEPSPVEVEIAPEQLRLASEHKAEMRGSKISGNLTRVFEEYAVRAQRKAPVVEPSETPTASLRMLTLARVVDGRVMIDATAETETAELIDQLTALGFEESASFGRIVSGRLPIEAIGALNTVPALRFAQASYAKLHTGAVTSQGDRAMWADLAREIYGVTGASVKVGILSDSFNCRGGYQRDIWTGDLPGNVTILAEEQWCESGTDEGRAMAQIVHDVAPGAALSFHTAFTSVADFAQGIKELAAKGAQVIVDDVIWFGEPMFQDGPLAQAVDEVTAKGVTYVSSAGNGAKKSYEAPFRPVIRNGRTVHDFDAGKKVVTAQTVTIPGWGAFIISFQWDEPFYSAGGAFGAQNDIDLHFYYRGQYLGSCDDNNRGGDAIEICAVTNDGPVGGSIQMVVELHEGPGRGLIKFVNFDNATFNFATQSGTCFGHANARGAIAVGAVDYRNTPRFGKPLVLEKFSSAGGVPILFDRDGRRLATPEIRKVPWVVAPDGVDTTFFGGKDTDRTGWPNFFGTSAAAPHVAGVAALMREDSPVLTPAEIRKRMAEMAVDFGPAGHDHQCGYGFIDAEFAVGHRPLGYDLTASWMPGTPKQTCVTKAGIITCSKLTGTIKVVNVGNRTSNPTKIAFFLSADETPDASEQVALKTLSTRLARNKSANVSVTVDLKKLKGGASVAGQHLIAVIDPARETFDPDDNNLIVGDIR